jgi:hypothetical protein
VAFLAFHRRGAGGAESLNQVSAPLQCPRRLCGEPGLETLSNYATPRDMGIGFWQRAATMS